MNTSVALFELAKCVISGTKSKILPLDYLEYLKSLEQLETIIALPPYIDENTFHLISKHRRQRIEYEIKVKLIFILLALSQSSSKLSRFCSLPVWKQKSQGQKTKS